MTNILLTLIAVLLLARVILQVRDVKKHFENVYCAPSEVENVCDVCLGRVQTVEHIIESRGKDGYEFTGSMSHGADVFLFFTRKKIKNYM